MTYERTPELRQRMSEHRKRLWADPESRYHTVDRRGPKASTWKGGQYRKGGYVWVWAPEHPRRESARRPYVKRAWVVAEQTLGRLLLPGENVHHINGIKDDDRPENLAVLTNSEHHRVHGPPTLTAEQQPRGERVNTAKLTVSLVREIREQHASGESIRSLAKRYSVSRALIGEIVHRRSWKHVI